MKPSLTPEATADIVASLESAAARFARSFPGEPAHRQPVHTVYGGAHLFRADISARLGRIALASLDAFARDPDEFAGAVGLDRALAPTILERVREKLRREPVEDFRIDFEDGYGNRPDDEEDACAATVAETIARGRADGTLPPFLGIRIKPLTGELHRRSIRTLDLVVSGLIEATGGAVPAGFVITLPKVTSEEEPAALTALLDRLENAGGVPPGTIRIELMVETPQSIIGPDGSSMLPRLVAACAGRCTGAHFGVYDYTASCSITAQHQSMTHPACDFARHVMQVALGGTGVCLSDGATNIMPVAPHRATPEAPLTAAQEAANRASVHRAWRLHYDDVRHSLRHAFYQGWDLNPAQLPTRYAAVFAFFLESLDTASERLANFVEQAAQATLVGDVFDDAATGQGLLNFFLRGLNCGAITEAEATRTGLTIDELRTRSFVRILAGRRGT